MQALQQIPSSSVIFPNLTFKFDEKTFQTTSNYIKKRSVAGKSKLKREQTEVSTVSRIIKDIQLLKNTFIFKQLRKEIESYLWNNQFLLDILFEAYEQITNIFSKNIEFHLELHRDYEEDFEELFIVIKSSLEPNVMLALMDKLDDEWFLGAMDATKGKLNITVEPL